MFAFQQAPRLDADGFTAFVLRGAGPRMQLAGLPVESIALDLQGSQFDLTVMAAEDGDLIRLSAEYNTDLFDAATIDRFLDRFETLLTSAAVDPTRAVGDLPLLPLTERERISDWRTGVPLTHDERTFVEIFEAQVGAHAAGDRRRGE